MTLLTAAVLAVQLTAGTPQEPSAQQAPAPQEPAQEKVVATQVHGNMVTTSDDVLRLGGVSVGMAVNDDVLWAVEERLVSSGLFESVEIRKRFASLDDPTQILLVVVVDEGDVRIERTDNPDEPVRVVRRRGVPWMILPILEIEYSYGLTYGGRLTFPGMLGEGSQVSVPVSWGGHKQAGVEFARVFERGPVTRVAGGGIIEERTNPFFDQDDERRRVWGRADRSLWRYLWTGVQGAWEDASMGDVNDRLGYFGADVTFDSRLDPYLARNAVYGHAGWERVFFDEGGGTTDRFKLEGRGYIGLFGQSTLVVRAVKEDASRALPTYLQYVLGGGDNLRGFPAGTAAGDTLVAGTLELRVPLTSPLGIGRIGLSAFADTGAVYAEGSRFSDQTFREGYGGGVWVSVAFVRLTMSVGHGKNGPTTFHIATNMAF